jgi:peptidoglycan/xylan/chitin deacetylase (PgdA/CDA1 family)
MTWLKQKGYTTITPDDLYEALRHGKKLPRLPVLLTFDDGYEDAYINAVPILSEFGFTGTFFVVTGWIDDNKDGYLSWLQAQEMVKEGMFIQNHSREHKDMRNRDHDWLVYQILGPEESIEAHTGVRPRFFCYPSGGYDDTVLRELDAAGVVAAFTENDSAFAYSDNMLRLPRMRIRGSTSLESFAYMMTWER